LDKLSAIFLGLVGVVSIAILIYSIKYIDHYNSKVEKNLLSSLLHIFILSLFLIISSANFFSFLFFWELMAVSAFILVMFDFKSKETRKAGLYYFIMTQLSTFFIFLGFLTIYSETNSFSINQLILNDAFTKNFIFVCLFLGFGIKAGMMPFHKWLPYAHPASPSNISAILSGLMIKIPIYALIRFLTDVLTPELSWGVVILLVGTFTGILGIIYALKEPVLKKMLAYSSIENIGVILTGIGLYIIFNNQDMPLVASLSLFGAIFHSINHAFFKTLLFMGAGVIINVTHAKNIEELGGLIKFMPYTAIFFLIGSLSISALPPFNGFISELMIYQAFFQAINLTDLGLKILLVMCLAIFGLTSALASACFIKAFGTTFLGLERTKKSQVKETVPFLMRLGQSFLALGCIILGLSSYYIFEYFGYEFNIPNMLLLALPLLVTFFLLVLFLRIFTNQKKVIGETWGCGLNSLSASTQYTPTGFSEPIMTIFKDIYRTKKESQFVYHDDSNSIVKNGFVELKLLVFFEIYLYDPIIKFFNRFSKLIAKLENDDANTYLLYVFLTIILLFVMLG
jgi:formate hydrogenlyase subunit 3/multisubunit Na+/H+ antiporter MnhD subunit